MGRFASLRLSTKLSLLVGIFLVGLVAITGVAWHTLGRVKVNGPVYREIVQGKDVIADVLPPPKYIIESYLVVLQMVEEKDKSKVISYIERGKKLCAEYEERQAFRTWLFQILVNRCRTAAVRRQRRQRMFLVDDNALAVASVRPTADTSDLRTELQRAIDALDPDHREAFLLKHVEQLSYDEMAAATGIGVSALKMRVKRACDRMQWLLREGEGKGETSDVGT